MMKTLCLTLLGALILVAATTAPKTTTDGTVIYTYGGAWPTLNCPVDLGCEIRLPDDAVAMPPVQSDPVEANWYVRAVHGTPGRVLLIPYKASLFMNLRIIGESGRDYVVYVRSESKVDAPVNGTTLEIVIPTPTPMPLSELRRLARLTMPTPTPTPDDPLANIDLRTLQCGVYDVRGHASFAPQSAQVCVDPVRTYIRIPDVEVIPILAAADDHGTPVLLNYGFRDDTFVVVGHYSTFTLIRGTGKTREEVDLVRVAAVQK